MSDDDAARTLVANERAKLAATYFNGLAVGLFIVGGVAPVFTFIFAQETARPSILLVVFGAVIGLGASVAYISWREDLFET